MDTVIRVPTTITLADPGQSESVEQPAELRWGRTQISGDSEHWRPVRNDWSDEPQNWELVPVAGVSELPQNVRRALELLDCAIPKYRGTIDNSVIWGELERPWQRDLAVLYVHRDQTSATYLFWAADPARREVMPHSGSAINPATPADIEMRLDRQSPREPDMPDSLDHDGVEIGCCECCSTIYYRHGGQWFTLSGAD